jgi:hypothetical protein
LTSSAATTQQAATASDLYYSTNLTRTSTPASTSGKSSGENYSVYYDTDGGQATTPSNSATAQPKPSPTAAGNDQLNAPQLSALIQTTAASGSTQVAGPGMTAAHEGIRAVSPAGAASVMVAVPRSPQTNSAALGQAPRTFVAANAVPPGELPTRIERVIQTLLAGPLPIAPQTAELVTGALPLDLSSLKQGIQAFFEQLENLGDEGGNLHNPVGLAPWYVAVGVATVLLEVARRRFRKQSGQEMVFQAGWQDPTSSWLPDPDGAQPER